MRAEYRSELDVPGLREGDPKENRDSLPVMQDNSDSTDCSKRKRTSTDQKSNISVPGKNSAEEPHRARGKPAPGRIIGSRVRQSYRHVMTPEGKKERIIHFVCTATTRKKLPRNPSNPHNNRAKNLADSSKINSTITNTVDRTDDTLPELESTEYVFDQNEYRRWHQQFSFNYDAAANTVSHKCRDYSSLTNPFEKLGPADLENKMLWIFPPTDGLNSIISHFEKIRRMQPSLTQGVLIVPNVPNTPGATFKEILKGYKKIHSYPKGTYLFKKYNPETLEYDCAPPTTYEYDVYLASADGSKDGEESSYGSDIRNNTIKYKPHQARYETKLCHVTNSSVVDDLIILKTPTADDTNLESLIDSGATLDFISESYVRENKLKTHKLENPLRVRLADGSMSISKLGVSLSFQMGDATLQRSFVITRLSGRNQLILGYKFLKEVNPIINWEKGTLQLRDTAEKISAVVQKRTVSSEYISAKSLARILQKEASTYTRNGVRKLKTEDNNNPAPRLYVCSIREILSSVQDSDTRLTGIQGWDEDTDTESRIKAIQTDYDESITDKLKAILRKNSQALEPLKGLPIQRPDYDMEIPFEGTPPNSKVYRMSPAELEELQRQLKDYLDRGWIRPSMSEFASGVMFAVKPGTNKLRLCVDYRQINRYTKKVGYSLPNIDNILDKLGNSQCFTAFDLASGYHQLRIKDYPEDGIDPDGKPIKNSKGEIMKGSDVHKTAFRTQYGTYEFLVVPFGLQGAPSTYQRLVNNILDPIRRPWLVCYLDDILVFSASPEEHLTHIQEVLEILVKNNLYVRPEKCQWMKTSLDYLGFTVQGATDEKPGGIRPSERKTRAVSDWPVPKTVKEVQSFLGFCNFYRRFCKDYASIASPLYGLTEKKPILTL